MQGNASILNCAGEPGANRLIAPEQRITASRFELRRNMPIGWRWLRARRALLLQQRGEQSKLGERTSVSRPVFRLEKRFTRFLLNSERASGIVVGKAKRGSEKVEHPGFVRLQLGRHGFDPG